MPLDIINPKRTRHNASDWDLLYPYYAGFPEGFARTLLESSRIPDDALVFDPWNGSGTTTKAAASLGLNAIGLDLNPVMSIVAKARLLSACEADSLLPIAHALLTASSKIPDSKILGDPLLDWFDEPTSTLIRGLEASVRMVAAGGLREAGVRSSPLEALSSLAAFYYVTLFAIVRRLSRGLRSSNPTWLRSPRNDDEKLSCTREQLNECFLQIVSASTRYFSCNSPDEPTSKCQIISGDCRSYRLGASKADFLLTSPPYCTRIDYAHLTRLELAVIFPLCSTAFRDLRLAMTGTTLTHRKRHGTSRYWGATCNNLLRSVKSHGSRASSGYYFNTHSDYFSKLYSSIRMAAANVKSQGAAVFVVQDSWYKDVHNDVPKIVMEMGESAGFLFEQSMQFPISRSFADLHPSRQGLNEKRPTTETVLVLRKS